MATKFSIKKNQDFWDKYSKKAKNRKFGAHSDSYIVDLENEFIVKQLKKIKASSLLDIGCGNSQRTLLFQKHISEKTVGIDYSKQMFSCTYKPNFVLVNNSKDVYNRYLDRY